MKLKSALQFSHELLKDTVEPGDLVVDATVGNGNDTVFLSQLVGKTGTVLGFDIQKLAIANTTEKLIKLKLMEPVQLFHEGHQNVGKHLNQKTVAAAIFNLGYLPTGNKEIITKPETTLASIKALLPSLKKGGLIILVLYYGHPGGEEEKDAVLNFASGLRQAEYNVLKYQFVNQKHEPPILLAIQKR